MAAYSAAGTTIFAPSAADSRSPPGLTQEVDVVAAPRSLGRQPKIPGRVLAGDRVREKLAAMAGQPGSSNRSSA